MAEYDDKAFGYMSDADPEYDIAGGAVDYSQYDMEFSPAKQDLFKKTLVSAFDSTYRNDPNKGELSYLDWMKSLKHDYINERALKWADVKGNRGDMNPEEYDTLERAGQLKSLFSMHTGRLEDARKLVEHIVPEPLKDSKIENRAFREPAGYAGRKMPQAVGE